MMGSTAHQLILLPNNIAIPFAISKSALVSIPENYSNSNWL